MFLIFAQSILIRALLFPCRIRPLPRAMWSKYFSFLCSRQTRVHRLFLFFLTSQYSLSIGSVKCTAHSSVDPRFERFKSSYVTSLCDWPTVGFYRTPAKGCPESSSCCKLPIRQRFLKETYLMAFESIYRIRICRNVLYFVKDKKNRQ